MFESEMEEEEEEEEKTSLFPLFSKQTKTNS